MKKIGLMGGTFDPPHIGHFIVAEAVLYELNLDEIWFIPTSVPPHKASATSSNDDRKKMLSLVIRENKNYKLILNEFKRKGKSYTIDTIKELRGQYPTYTFYFVIGADMVEYLPNWHKIDELVKMITFVGVGRPHYQLKTTYPIINVDVPLVDISSSDIKNRIKNKREVEYFIPRQVLEYIKEHHLYGF